MRALQHWSVVQVLLGSVAWVVATLALAAGYIYMQIGAAAAETGSAGIGLIIPSLVLLILAMLGGPATLMIAWLVARGRA